MKRILIIFCVAFLVGNLYAQCTSPAPTHDNLDNSNVNTVTKETPAKSKVIKITQSEFAKKIFDYNDPQAVYTGKKPIVVDCYADWCGPCRMLAPTVEELAEQYNGEVIFYKLNVDNAKELSKALEIRSIPTILYIKPNTQPQRTVGYLEKKELEKVIDEFLLEKSTEEGSGK